MVDIPRLVVAAPHSGAGKTTVTTGLIAALSGRMPVQAFKCGPDYIDPTYHARAAGRPSRNLDTWLLPDAAVIELFERACSGADIAIIEGVMGLFDGKTGSDDSGSTAHLAKLLRAPVVLVLDASAMARSAAALVHGFHSFDPDLRLAGVIVNRVAGEGHYRIVADAIERETGVEVLGYQRRDSSLAIPERYLGLIPSVEGPVAPDHFDRLRAAVEETIDVGRLERIATSAPALPAAPANSSLFPGERIAMHVCISVARDAAFSFYYEDNLDLLRAWGADIAEFSPLDDEDLPTNTGGIYIGGGFPELYAAQLSINSPMLEAIRSAAAAGMPVYAECGGLMYAGEQLEDNNGRRHHMLGIVPARTVMSGERLTLGYREIRALANSPILEAGERTRAHEFHYSRLQGAPLPQEAAYSIDAEERLDGYRSDSVLASYMHVHFGGSRTIAPRFVAAAKAWLGKERRYAG
jgi:cobyrinic acid a,c-diamide synthase